jgi:hypothetical protein
MCKQRDLITLPVCHPKDEWTLVSTVGHLLRLTVNKNFHSAFSWLARQADIFHLIAMSLTLEQI